MTNTAKINAFNIGQKRRARMQRNIWRIWAYVRRNSHSLDSDIHCREVETRITSIVNNGLEKLDELVGVSRKDLADAKKTIRELRAELKDKTA